MAERPDQETGPRVRATLSLPDELWNELQVSAIRQGASASALVAELIDGYLDMPGDERAVLADRAKRWMRPKGGAARADGDSD